MNKIVNYLGSKLQKEGRKKRESRRRRKDSLPYSVYVS